MSIRRTNSTSGRFHGWLTVLLLSVAHACSAQSLQGTETGAISPDQAEQLFAHQLWPTISSSCLACHGEDPNKLKGGLDLRSHKGAMLGGDSGSAIVPREPKKSLLIEAIRWDNEDLQMPPKENERLSDSMIELFEQWIQAGAPWPSIDRTAELVNTTEDQWSVPNGIQVQTSGGLKPEWTNRKYLPENLWAYQPLSKPRPPGSDQHPIDAFVDAKIKPIQLEPAPAADRLTLIRRASYDLLGLPPTPQEVTSFVTDPRSNSQAFSDVIERLLSNPHYGEQWGRHWLDVVRYADTSGFANDFDRGNAWRYRDYVVRAFNDDKPFRDFIHEQIAGDELAPNNPENLVAVGFLRMGPWELTGMEVPAIARQRFLDDAVNAVGQSFLGHTLRCAKCHDHKFDPIPTQDYYSLYTTFNTTQLSERKAPFLPVENLSGFDERSYLLMQKQQAAESLEKLTEKSAKAVVDWFQDRDLPYKTRAEAQSEGLSPDKIPPRRYGFDIEDFGKERIGRKTLGRLKWKLERYEPIAFSVYSGRSPKRSGYTTPQRIPMRPLKKGDLEKGHILTGGDPFSEGDPVRPNALSVLNKIVPELVEIEFPEHPAGRRTALSKWISHPRNPLTYRSIANRIWQWHFGRPLAGNPNNLGASGKKPSHPQLLDWLAVEFRDSGGSFKSLHRLIMNSETYQRSSTHPEASKVSTLDPEGISYAAFHPRRLRSEEFRDSMLAVSGELNSTMGGIPNRPEINLEVALQPRMVMGTFATAWQPNPLPHERHRRSLYALKVRGLRDPFMEVFNEPDPDLSCEARDASNVTPQVFSLFNSQIAYDRAVAFALRVEAKIETQDEAIRLAFELALNRPPSSDEFRASLKHLEAMKIRHQSTSIPKPDYPIEVVREAVEENTGEKFQFTERLNVFEDFIPDKKIADVPPKTRALAELCLVLFNSNEFAYIY
jgi:hypothetical protein